MNDLINKNLMPVAVAAVIDRMIFHPMETVITLRQDSGKKIPAIIRQLNSLGLKAFYPGYLPSVLSAIPVRMSIYSTYSIIKDQGKKQNTFSPKQVMLFGGVSSGVAEALVLCPSEAYRTRQALNVETKNKYKLRTMYSGFVPLVARTSIENTICLLGSDALLDTFFPKSKDQALPTYITGMVAGSASQLIGGPIDTIKTRVMKSHGQDISIGQHVKDLIAEKSLFRSVGMRALRAGVCNSMILGTAQVVQNVMQRFESNKVDTMRCGMATTRVDSKVEQREENLPVWKSRMSREFLAGAAAGTVIAYGTFPLEGIKKYIQSHQGEVIAYSKDSKKVDYKVAQWKASAAPGSVLFAYNNAQSTWNAHLLKCVSSGVVTATVGSQSPYMRVLGAVKKENNSFFANQRLLHILRKEHVGLFGTQSVRVEPFKAYRGSAAFASSIIPTTIIQFITDDILKRYFSTEKDASPHMKMCSSAFSSAFCGVMGALSGTFVENVIVRQQLLDGIAKTKAEKGPIYAIKDMIRHGGVLRPWKSYPLIAARDGIFTLCMLWALEEFANKAKDNLGEKYVYPTRLAVGVMGALLSHPFDTVATQLQASHSNATAAATAKKIYQTEGIKGFYRGFPYRLGLFVTFTNIIPKVKMAADEKIDAAMGIPKKLSN